MRTSPISFQDADFPHGFAWCEDNRNRTLRWVPYGMPRLNPRMHNLVFYLYGRDPRTGARRGPMGTGIFVTRGGPLHRDYWSPVLNVEHIYAVTCHHVAVGAGASIIRVNATVADESGVRETARYIEREPHEWAFVGGGDDIAVTDVTDEVKNRLTPTGFDRVRTVTEFDFANTPFMKRCEVSVGEDGFMLGLFTQNPGTDDYFVPAARFGNISQLAHPNFPVEQGNGVARPSHVFDMHSRPGFSGSPVFIYRTPAADLSEIGESQEWALRTHNNVFLKLLGIHSAQFEEDLIANKKEAYGQIPIYDGDKITVSSSMTVVVPAETISNVLDHPALQEQREMREKRHRETKHIRARVRPETAAKKAELEDANPSHKEDFRRLLNAAAQKQQPDDQT